ncbi:MULTISPECIES: LexA family protein [unclassified Alistipes]|uniref:LexA family protein n=1 Tax=unclassified Alistipes TaxID=2608932 RepID=UPI0007A867F8|nr:MULTISPECIES: translesion error-prone DNA polymerase V autoproteolytic subunit [unclassified Alistipes]CVI66157.1 LexA repressor [Alistipes sp. CHKCI003]HAW64836.1 peptidase S24 [Alistipes sp.]HJC76093.1 translesion error-prone DNA polymerase V autoproteolytic subunit [Candidatus Alistipes excrementavium]
MEASDDKLKIYRPEPAGPLEIPLAESGVHAGFPSPADDFLEGSLDLNRLVVRHPEATFFARVEGDSMQGEGIAEGDLLVVDKAVEPYDGCLAVAYVDGEFTLKRVRIEPHRILLVPANPKYRTIEVSPDREFAVWGVVKWILKSV